MRSKKICSRILGSSFGGGTSCSWTCNWAYSAAVRNFPSIGDRASMIIFVRNISSGVSSGGGNAITADPQWLLNPTNIALITIILSNFIAFLALTLPISWTAFTTQDENLFFLCSMTPLASPYSPSLTGRLAANVHPTAGVSLSLWEKGRRQGR